MGNKRYVRHSFNGFETNLFFEPSVDLVCDNGFEMFPLMHLFCIPCLKVHITGSRFDWTLDPFDILV